METSSVNMWMGRGRCQLHGELWENAARSMIDASDTRRIVYPGKWSFMEESSSLDLSWEDRRWWIQDSSPVTTQWKNVVRIYLALDNNPYDWCVNNFGRRRVQIFFMPHDLMDNQLNSSTRRRIEICRSRITIRSSMSSMFWSTWIFETVFWIVEFSHPLVDSGAQFFSTFSISLLISMGFNPFPGVKNLVTTQCSTLLKNEATHRFSKRFFSLPKEIVAKLFYRK